MGLFLCSITLKKNMLKRGKLKFILIVFVVLGALFFTYFEYVNRNSKNMTGKQKLLKSIYPLVMGVGKLFHANSKVMTNSGAVEPQISFYSLKATANNGEEIDFDEFKGKKVLLVNTASDCGYTGQYDDLQKLYSKFKDQLIVIGFPANDFRDQEKGSDQEIAKFCKLNYGVTFPLARKSSVVKGSEQNKVFEWLSHKNENGWNDQEPSWNFSKYLVNEQGVLLNYFDPSISPGSEEFIAAVTH
jgi:glutathione peroxidase